MHNILFFYVILVLGDRMGVFNELNVLFEETYSTIKKRKDKKDINNLKDKTGKLQEKKDNKIKGVVNLETNRRGIKSWKILKHYNFF